MKLIFGLITIVNRLWLFIFDGDTNLGNNQTAMKIKLNPFEAIKIPDKSLIINVE